MSMLLLIILPTFLILFFATARQTPPFPARKNVA